ncbi:hypothetical protein EV03_1460 [Prochlorococcus marinus str. PAC1]|uniref:Uncharacterized protein n=1 Tax=Prochlorococcus marinus str. PAC1 TaxID=59924 RepID=A0A0A2C0W9_PROMR|nr:hypothetical protein EV03_1460 [Prochlorococcus marinus str. PAC1]
MRIFLLLSLIILTIFFICKRVFYSAKRNLFKDQAEWFSKDIKIKYSKSKEISKSDKHDNYLKIIAEESKFYLEEQSNQDKESNQLN